MSAKLLKPISSLLLVVFLPFAIFWSVTIGQDSFYFHDLQYLFYPRFKLAFETILSGEFPWWNPWNFAGVPLFADSQASILYPPSALFLILEPAYALNIFILFHISWAALGMLLFGRGVGFRDAASILMAVSFSLSGFMMGHLIHPSLIAGASWVPWSLLILTNSLRSHTKTSFVAFVIALVMQILTGHPQIPIYTAIALFFYGLYLSATREKIKFIYRYCLAYLCALLICAPQLLPLLEALKFSNRAVTSSFEFYSAMSLDLSILKMLVYPFSFGTFGFNPFHEAHAYFQDQHVLLAEFSIYAGLLTLLLGFCGLVLVIWNILIRKTLFEDFKIEHAFIAILLIGLFVSFAKFTGAAELFNLLPVLNRLRDPSRASLFIIAAICFFAAYFVNSLKTNKFSKLLEFSIIFVVVSDFSFYAKNMQVLTPRSQLIEIPGSATFLSQDKSLYRKITLIDHAEQDVSKAKELLFGSWNMTYKIPDINGFNSLQPASLSALLYKGRDLSYGKFPPSQLSEQTFSLLSLLNVKYFITQSKLESNVKEVYNKNGVTIYENINVLSRLFFIQKLEKFSIEQILIKMQQDNINYANTALIDTELAPLESKFSSDAKILNVDYSANLIKVSLDVKEDAFLVISDTFYPGWKAKINGLDSDIYPVNYFLKGVVVPKGSQDLQLDYFPNYLFIGLFLMLFGFGCVAFLTFRI
jgi:Bacterial membrane protein YfhO